MTPQVLLEQESGKSLPDAAALLRMSALGINVNWLLAGKGPMLLDSLAAGDEANGAAHAQERAFVTVPVLPLAAEAGSSNADAEDPHQARLAFSREWLRRRGLQSDGIAAIKISGDSMEPTIRDGALVVVDLSQKTIGNGIYVLMVDGHLMAKRLQTDFLGGVYVRSDNPLYREEHLTAQELSELLIVGRIVWSGWEVY